ncbi:serine/threonine-protein kinase Nek2-like [Amphiura filiformis]|uniref:serine/threonine-protein kinase Nek2-like n=1 Tax=Amphiura filiformis TaxID=82378 RepID=UPI003B217401
MPKKNNNHMKHGENNRSLFTDKIWKCPKKISIKMSSKLDNYEILYTIGTGSYGTCKKIRRKNDGKVLVWKEMDYSSMSSTEKQMLVSEVNLLRELKHKYIVRYYDRVVDKTNATIYIIMEYCEGGDLGSLIAKCRRERKYLEEDFIWKVFRQVTLALQECHRRGKGRAILHRDLKPANVFLDKYHNVKLGDFGLARVLQHETSFAKTFVGTPYYMSPEQMSRTAYNEKSDIWALGCLVYELCALSPPFTASNQTSLAVKIKEGNFKRIPSQYSDELSTCVGSMLRVRPILRPSIDEILKHKKLSSQPEKLEPVSNSSDEAAEAQQVADSMDELREALKTKESSLKKREDILELRERAVDLKERHVDSREERFKEKERSLEAREKAIVAMEKEAEDKCSRAETLIKQYMCMKTNNRVKTLKCEKEFSEGVHPDQLPLKLQKKRVHFAPSGKENLPSHQEAAEDTTATKTSELKDRLYQAKLRGVALKQVELTSKYRSKQLLSMR